MIHQRKMDELQRLEKMGVGFVIGDDDWAIEDPDPEIDEEYKSQRFSQMPKTEQIQILN